ERANTALAEDGHDPLPRLTPHSLRRSFTSLLFALGRDPVYVMGQLGHTDPSFTLRVYARAMRLREATGSASPRS
ncbi:MAG TPA: tyrosine-type recombinase/integrase, partial [Thermoleophilaceae bacterium]